MSEQVAVLLIVAFVFVWALREDWELTYMVFGLVLLLGSCRVLGI
jgi:hypothetical protein